MSNTTTDFEEWLDSLGFNDSSPENNTQAEQSAIAHGDLPSEPQVVEEVHFHLHNETIDVPVIHEESSTTPNVQSVSFSEEDMDSLLADNGFAEPAYDEAEEVHDGSDDEGVEDEPDGYGVMPRYVGTQIPDSIGDTRVNPETGNVEVLTEHGIEVVSPTVRDLDAEEDADWQEAIDSGGIVPVMEANMQSIASETPSTQEEAMAYPHREPLIPENSPTVSIDDSTSRFSGTEWYNEMLTKTIMIAGCGGIGSNLAYQIARLKPYSIVLYDDDRVELANMSGQLFKRSDIGNHKVSAVHDMLFNYTGMYNVRAVSQRFTPATTPTDIMMCGFDSMEARKTYFNAWKRHLATIPQEHCKDCFFMDGRLTINIFQIFCLTGEDTYNMERYEREFLFDDSQADSEVCSQKQTTYLACMIGSVMTNLFINWVAGSLDPIIPYKLPFFTQYEAQHMIFKTEE